MRASRRYDLPLSLPLLTSHRFRPHTGKVKKVGPRLRELAPVARGGQDAGSRTLGPVVSWDSVLDVARFLKFRTCGSFCLIVK